MSSFEESIKEINSLIDNQNFSKIEQIFDRARENLLKEFEDQLVKKDQQFFPQWIPLPFYVQALLEKARTPQEQNKILHDFLHNRKKN